MSAIGNLPDYLALSGRTEKRFPKGLALEGLQVELIHAALGCAGEAGEIAEAIASARDTDTGYDRVNLGEEAGDYAWFLAALSRRLLIAPEVISHALVAGETRDTSIEAAACALTAAASPVVDGIKRHVIYGKPLDRDALVAAVVDAWTALATFCVAIGLDRSRVMEANIAKLAARFGEAYSDTKANFRDLHNERERLVGGLGG